MTMAPTTPDIDTDQDLFTVWDDSLDSEVQCDASKDCENEVEWFVKCGICQMAEVVCTMHKDMVEDQIRTDMFYTFIFDHTCGHTVLARLCKIEPM